MAKKSNFKAGDRVRKRSGDRVGQEGSVARVRRDGTLSVDFEADRPGPSSRMRQEARLVLHPDEVVLINGQSARQHATKKSPAQLQREIDAVLASPGSSAYEEAMDALSKKHTGIKRGGSLRSGHAPVVPTLTRKTRWAPSHATKSTDKDYRVTVRVEGAPKPVHVSPWMTLAQAEHAANNHKAMVRDRGWTHVVDIEDKSGPIRRTSHATKMTPALFKALDAIAFGERVTASMRAKLIAAGLVDSRGRITDEGSHVHASAIAREVLDGL